MAKQKTIAIIHFSTPELTEACILSIRKQGIDWPIVVFDNSRDVTFPAGEGMAVRELTARPFTKKMKGVKVIGPNCPGVISPGKSMVGIMPTGVFKQGHTGVISRSGTLTYEVVYDLVESGLGISTAVVVGGDPVVGIYFEDLLQMFQDDPETDSIAMIGEIGGDAEERAAEFIKAHVTKPVAVFISGRQAPPGKQMGHAGAIISGGSGSAEGKIKALEAAGVPVADETRLLPELLKARL